MAGWVSTYLCRRNGFDPWSGKILHAMGNEAHAPPRERSHRDWIKTTCINADPASQKYNINKIKNKSAALTDLQDPSNS